MNILKDSCEKSDPAGITKILSNNSKMEIESMISIFRSMDYSQLNALSKKFNMTSAELKNLTIDNYISIQLMLSRQTGEDKLSEIGKYNVIGINRTDEQAAVKLENGMEYLFVREGPYWKYEYLE